MAEPTRLRRITGRHPRPEADPPWGVQRYVEEPPTIHVHTHERYDHDHPSVAEDLDYLDNPAPGYEPAEPTDNSTIAFTLAMATAFLGLFVPATAWWLPAVLCFPTAFFILRARTDHIRKRRVRPVLLGLAVAGLLVGILCSIWGYNVMQDLKANLECLSNVEDISTYESGDC